MSTDILQLKKETHKCQEESLQDTQKFEVDVGSSGTQEVN